MALAAPIRRTGLPRFGWPIAPVNGPGLRPAARVPAGSVECRPPAIRNDSDLSSAGSMGPPSASHRTTPGPPVVALLPMKSPPG